MSAERNALVALLQNNYTGHPGTPADAILAAGWVSPETHAEVVAERDRLIAEVKHWKDHAAEAGAGFAQVCKDAARLAARNRALSEEREQLYADSAALRAALKEGQ